MGLWAFYVATQAVKAIRPALTPSGSKGVTSLKPTLHRLPLPNVAMTPPHLCTAADQAAASILRHPSNRFWRQDDGTPHGRS